MTETLQKIIQRCWDAVALEDIYLPYKIKRNTRAETARLRGLEPLARIIYQQRSKDLNKAAQKYLSDQLSNIDEVFSGARDIIAEWINEDQDVRGRIRREYARNATLQSKLVKKYEQEATKYKDYFDFNAPLKRIPSHRLLAIRRAEKEGFLRVRIAIDQDLALKLIEKRIIKSANKPGEQVKVAIAEAYSRLLSPSIENEFKKRSKEKADQEAIDVFANNARQLLMAPPAGAKVTLGIDPGFRTGCKVVVVNEQGDLMHHETIYPHPPQHKWSAAVASLSQLVKKYNVYLIAVGDGTAGRETMELVQAVLVHYPSVQAYAVNESGASIYSASDIARAEFPHLDLTVRGAISIARRLMDPLAELVKINPKSIGVGQYQHDVDQQKLKQRLDQVVSLAVNKVGVNLNTSSRSLLSYVSGIGATLAQQIIDYRTEHQSFKNRDELKKIRGLGPKTFEQCAGFLKIPSSTQLLDHTTVHPEAYPIVKRMVDYMGVSLNQLINNASLINSIPLGQFVTDEVGLPTLSDIAEAMAKPGLDVRGEATTFAFDDSIRSMDDLRVGQKLPGKVSNLTKFGAFVDIGIKENGLIHISQIVDRFITDPADVLSLGQQVDVRVLSIDMDRKRIQLSMKDMAG
ncbi:UNVERIFIED_CONTAM: hypothetical protein GTU68_034565 [Idotea baltica]|nr:hypothetical protein [Idotea baltica]